ncbi:MAG: hypothetical protein ABI353_07780, partial [Isosphaeraceae bacterium]
MVRLQRCIPALILGLVILVMPTSPAQAQFMGGGMGYGGMGYGGMGYGGMGYGGMGYGGMGYGGMGYGGRGIGMWPGVGFS